MPHRPIPVPTSAAGAATGRVALRETSPRSVAALTLALSTVLAVTMLLALPAQAQAQSYAGDVTENRFNPRSLLAPSNPYSLQGDTTSVDSYVESYRGGDLELRSNDGKYLGTLYGNDARGRFAPDSVTNPYGRYGSKYSADSIRNEYGRYGSPYSSQSVRNPYASPGSMPKAFDTNPGLSWGARSRPTTGYGLPTLPALPSHRLPATADPEEWP